MDESDLIYFVTWFAITGIIMVVTGISYRTYLRRKSHASSPS